VGEQCTISPIQGWVAATGDRGWMRDTFLDMGLVQGPQVNDEGWGSLRACWISLC
jgi:hypothetical protein